MNDERAAAAIAVRDRRGRAPIPPRPRTVLAAAE
jgi:hypothetical protein